MDNKLVLTNGTVYAADSIISCTFTESCNSETDICPGAVCSAEAEIELRAEYGTITQGTQFTLFAVDSDGNETQLGVFTAEKPERISAVSYRVVAYDNVSKTYADASAWLQEHQSAFPMTLQALVEAGLEQCGLTLAGEVPNGDFQVQAFSASDLTWNQILIWAGQVACRFVRANAQGEIEFGWYVEHASSGIGPGDGIQWTALGLSGPLLATVNGEIWTYAQPQNGYYADKLSFEDYETAALDKVQIKQTDDDVGVIYPPDETGANAYVIQGNMLLAPISAETLSPIAEYIYNELRNIFPYTPGEVSVFPTLDYRAGDIITVTPLDGKSRTFYLTEVEISESASRLTCTGNPSRDSVSAVNQQTYSNLQGKVLEIQTSVDGLNVSVVKNGEVRTKFALDSTSVTINTGVIAFTSDSISIDSQNFRLETNGNVTATGIFRSNNGVSGTGRNESVLSSGSLQLYRTLNNGQNTIAASLSSAGQNAAMGHFALYGATGVQMLTADADFAGMRFVLRDGYGHGMITMSPTNGGSAEFEGNVDIKGSVGLGVTTTINCANLNAYGSKNRAVLTARGYVGMGAMESPQPAFADFGCGVCDDDGLCLLQLDPRYLATVAPAYAPRWSITATAPGTLWLEKRGQDALVHGAAGQTFDWIVISPQRGYENQYAEPVDGSPPPAQVPSRDVADVLPGTIDPPSDIIPNTDTIAASQSLAAERRPA